MLSIATSSTPWPWKARLRFTGAYVACPLCAPSRTAILAGRYPQRFGVYVNEDINQAGVPREQLLLPKLLQQSGYATRGNR